MREVKFRIWDNPTNKMYFDVLVGNCNGENTCPCVFINEKGWVHTDNCIIEQFTGLHDKNGVEIYEGDVVSFGNIGFGNRKVFAEVKMNDGCFDVVNDVFRDYLKCYVANKSVEVIGNIHERSEDNDK